MNAASCPACQSPGAKYAFEKATYQIYECVSCRSLFVDPCPTFSELEAFYKDTSIGKLSSVCWADDANSSGSHLQEVWEEALAEIKAASGYGALLDVGCGTGRFLGFARSRGWTDLSGLELVPHIAEQARSRTGAKVTVAALEEAGLPSNSFVGVILWDVVEHVSDLNRTLLEAFRILAPGGTIVISTCSRDGISLRTFGKRSLTIDPPEHVLFLTKRGISAALKDAGFEVRAAWSFSIYLREWTTRQSDSSKQPSIANGTSKNLSALFARSKPLLYAMKVANYFLKRANLGDELVAIARKSNGT
jgi:SAM-dependent methyltransferase